MSAGDVVPATTTAIGSGVAVSGSLLAQVTNADVGNAALIVAYGGLLTGVLGGITQLFKLWLDSQSYSTRVQKLEADLKYTRERRHDDANRLNAIGLELQAEKLRAARLEGQLGQTANTHAEAINANSTNSQALAEQIGVTLPAPSPHIDPIVSDSLDDVDAFLLPPRPPTER